MHGALPHTFIMFLRRYAKRRKCPFNTQHAAEREVVAERVSLLREGKHGLERRCAGGGRKRKADETATPVESVKASDDDDEIDELTPAAPKDRPSMTDNPMPKERKTWVEGLELFFAYLRKTSSSRKGLQVHVLVPHRRILVVYFA